MGEYKFTPNPYRIEGDTAHIALYNRAGDFVAEALIDLCDLDRVLAFGRWSPVPSQGPNRHSYAVCAVRRKSLHRLIVGSPKGLLVDHKNGNPMNCRRSNLRPCTQSQNQQNRRGPNRASTSGVRNVSWNKAKNRWDVRMHIDNKSVRLGSFRHLEDAEAAAIEGRRRLMPFATD